MRSVVTNESESRSVMADVVNEEVPVRRRNYQTSMHSDCRMASSQHTSGRTDVRTNVGNAVGNASGNIVGNAFHDGIGNAVGTSNRNSRTSVGIFSEEGR